MPFIQGEKGIGVLCNRRIIARRLPCSRPNRLPQIIDKSAALRFRGPRFSRLWRWPVFLARFRGVVFASAVAVAVGARRGHRLIRLRCAWRGFLNFGRKGNSAPPTRRVQRRLRRRAWRLRAMPRALPGQGCSMLGVPFVLRYRNMNGTPSRASRGGSLGSPVPSDFSMMGRTACD